MWAVGEEVVFVGHPIPTGGIEALGIQPLTVGQKTTVAAVRPVKGPVRNCKTHPDITQRVKVSDSTRWWYCPHCFRKPINFQQLLNIQTGKELEDA